MLPLRKCHRGQSLTRHPAAASVERGVQSRGGNARAHLRPWGSPTAPDRWPISFCGHSVSELLRHGLPALEVNPAPLLCPVKGLFLILHSNLDFHDVCPVTSIGLLGKLYLAHIRLFQKPQKCPVRLYSYWPDKHPVSLSPV